MFFEEYAEPLRDFFEMDLDKQDAIIKLLNEKGMNLTVSEFADITGFTRGYDNHVLQVLGIMIRDLLHSPKDYHDALNISKLPQIVKSRMLDFADNLNETGKNGLAIKYFIDGHRVTSPSLEYLHHTVFINDVENDDDKIVCHTPIINLEFAFSDKLGTSSNVQMSLWELQTLIDDLKGIYQATINATETFKVNNPKAQIAYEK